MFILASDALSSWQTSERDERKTSCLLWDWDDGISFCKWWLQTLTTLACMCVCTHKLTRTHKHSHRYKHVHTHNAPTSSAPVYKSALGTSLQAAAALSAATFKLSSTSASLVPATRWLVSSTDVKNERPLIKQSEQEPSAVWHCLMLTDCRAESVTRTRPIYISRLILLILIFFFCTLIFLNSSLKTFVVFYIY